jgi:hypothetical protein
MKPLEDSEIEVALYTTSDETGYLVDETPPNKVLFRFYFFCSGKPIMCWCMLREALQFGTVYRSSGCDPT